MFSLIRRSAGLAMAAGLLAVAPMPSAFAAADEKAEICTTVTAERCDFTAGREGVHRIQLAVPTAQAGKLRELTIGGQQCPLQRQLADGTDGTVNVACFAYLSGGVTYKLAVPASSQVSIVRADPANGEPVTLIP